MSNQIVPCIKEVALRLEELVKQFEDKNITVTVHRVAAPDASGTSQYRGLINHFGVSRGLEQGVLDFLVKGSCVGIYLNSVSTSILLGFPGDIGKYDSFDVVYKTVRFPYNESFTLVSIAGYEVHDTAPEYSVKE